MSFLNIIEELNIELLNKQNTNSFSYKEYFNYIYYRIHKRQIPEYLISYLNNIQSHYNEFYIHFTDFKKLKININKNNILMLIKKINLLEGYDYITLTNNKILIGSHRNIISPNSININLLDTKIRLLNTKHIKQLIDNNNNFDIHYIFTPNGFIKMIFNNNPTNNFIDIFLNMNIIYDGYIRYIQAQNKTYIKKINSQESLLKEFN